MGIYRFFKLSFAGFALALIITGAIVYWQSLQLRKQVKQLVAIEEPLEKSIIEIEIISLKIADAIKTFVYVQNPAYQDSITQEQALLAEHFTTFQSLNRQSNVVKVSKKFNRIYQKFNQTTSDILEQCNGVGSAIIHQKEFLVNQFNHQLQSLHQLINSRIHPVIHKKNQDILYQAQLSSFTIGLMVLISLICFGFGMLFISRYIKNNIIQPIVQLKEASQDLAKGIYVEKWGNIVNIPKVNREIAQLCLAFNKMASGLHIFIKQQKKDNAQLKKVNQNFLKAQKIAQIGSWELDIATQKLKWDPQMYHIFGLQENTYINTEILKEQVHPKDFDHVHKSFQQLSDYHTPYQIDYRITHPNTDQWHFLHSEAEIIYNDQQIPLKAIGITQDVTHLKKAQGLLESYRKILDKAAIVATTDVKGNITYVNDKFCEISKYNRDELLGKNHRLLKSGNLPDSAYKELWQTISNGNVWQGEIQNKAKDGSFYWVNATIMPFMNEKNKPYMYMAIRFDITLQKNYANRLKTQILELNDYKFALDTAAIVAITNVKGKITYVNDKFCEISGFSREELLDQDHEIINSGYHSSEFIRKMWETIAQGEVWRGEFKNLAKDGSYYWVDTTIVPFLNEKGKPYMYLTIRIDITNKKSLEEDLRSYQTHLEEKVQERTQELENERNRVKEMNEELITQNELIEEKNKNITDSIEYALRIQEATLPQIDTIKASLPELFILYKPRDIVSGDFYWFSEVNQRKNSANDYNYHPGPHNYLKEKKLVIAAVDCTGHGVPGAFMSMIGNQLLDEIVNILDIVEPHFILNELNKKVRLALKQDELDNQDGMDMSICVIDKKKRQLEFAGAKNSLVYTQNGLLGELTGDRTSIGGFKRPGFESFTKHTLKLTHPRQTFYMFSDGYQDQMGGEKGLKFMRRNLHKIFLENYSKPMDQQQQILEENFDEWRGKNFEQLDDVLIMGFRVDV